MPTTSIADLCNEINSNSTLKDKIIARYSGNVLVFETVEKGVKGNLYRVGIQGDTNTYSKEIHLYFDLVSGFYPFIRQDQNLTVKLG